MASTQSAVLRFSLDEIIGISLSEIEGAAGELSSSNDTPRTCLRCGTQSTPKWRRGGSLCNACGLRDNKWRRTSEVSGGVAAERPGAKDWDEAAPKRTKKMRGSSQPRMKGGDGDSEGESRSKPPSRGWKISPTAVDTSAEPPCRTPSLASAAGCSSSAAAVGDTCATACAAEAMAVHVACVQDAVSGPAPSLLTSPTMPCGGALLPTLLLASSTVCNSVWAFPTFPCPSSHHPCAYCHSCGWQQVEGPVSNVTPSHPPQEFL